MSKNIDKSKLDVRKSSKINYTVYIPLTGYIEEDKKYVIRVEKIKRILNNGESFIENKVIIQDVEEVKKICQNWNEIKCEDCEEFKKCEQNN